LAVFANREAERYYRSAQELADTDLERAGHLAGLGEALFRQSRYEEAIQAWLDAIAIYQPAGSADDAARLYARAARSAWYAAAPERGLELCRTGMINIPTSLETAGVAALLHETARAYFFNNQATEALALCQQALDLSKRLELGEVQAETLATMGLLPNQPPELKKQHLTEAVALAESAGLVATASRAHLNLGGRLFESGEFASARAHFAGLRERPQDWQRLVDARQPVNRL
jgi:tetratricopeptide (TPR) repeat protein